MANVSTWKTWVGPVCDSRDSYEESIRKMAGWLGVGARIRESGCIILKPNLTYPFFQKGVTTGPVFLEAVVRVLRDLNRNLVIVESDGGANAWTADQAFQGHGIPDICRTYGATMMNLTKQTRKRVRTEIAGREVEVVLPEPLLRPENYFVTLPVPKVHVMTRVSLGFKNQWGCLPDVKRLRNHPLFPYKVVAINKILNTQLALFDGTYFLNRTGPMRGDAVEMNLVLGGSAGAASLVCCELMGIDPQHVPHLSVAMKEGMMPRTLAEIEMNRNDIDSLRKGRFYLQRSVLDWATLLIFRSGLLTWMVYDSLLAKPIHEALYVVRGRPKDVQPRW
jgi:uncharacterized protein (DUF362 family)